MATSRPPRNKSPSLSPRQAEDGKDRSDDDEVPIAAVLTSIREERRKAAESESLPKTAMITLIPPEVDEVSRYVLIGTLSSLLKSFNK